jgi:hypothetical protein
VRHHRVARQTWTQAQSTAVVKIILARVTNTALHNFHENNRCEVPEGRALRRSEPPSKVRGSALEGEGMILSIEWRWTEGQYNRLPSLANELVGRGVDVIVTWDAPSSFAGKGGNQNHPDRLLDPRRSC